MTTRFSIEGSRQRGLPVDLYQFITGDGPGDYLAYTSAEQPVVHEGITFEPLPINRDSVKAKSRGETADLKVEVPASAGIASLFRGGVPRRVVFLKIWHGHLSALDEPAEWQEFALAWSGRVLETARKKNLTVLACDSLGAGMKRPGLTRNYQRECSLVLYGPRCRASRAAATAAVTVATASGKTVTLPGGWHGLNAAANYVGGVFEWVGPFGTETRTIVSAGDTSVTLDSLVSDLPDGAAANVILGCPRTMDACAALHSNIQNYGGHPFIPLENPVNQNNHT